MAENEDRGTDDDVDPDAATATVATRLTTLPPVQNVADLPESARDLGNHLGSWRAELVGRTVRSVLDGDRVLCATRGDVQLAPPPEV